MKNRYKNICVPVIILVLSFGLLTVSVAHAKKHYKSGASCNTNQSCTNLHSNCKCFCAFKHQHGDYREKMPKQDHPIFFADPKKDKFGKGCYCAARDIKVLQAVANGMPIYQAREKYKNYNSSKEKAQIHGKKLTSR